MESTLPITDERDVLRTAGEWASELLVSLRTIQRWCGEGLPHHRHRRSLAITHRDIHQWLSKRPGVRAHKNLSEGTRARLAQFVQ